MSGMNRYLECTDVIDYESESIKGKARALTAGFQADRDGERHVEHRTDPGWFDDFPLDYLIDYCSQSVTEQGWDWNEFTDNMIAHKAE